MIKRKLQVALVCKTENGNSIEIGEGELGVSNDLEVVLGRETQIRVVARLHAGEFYNFNLNLSEKTLMALRNAIEEAPEDPLGHLLVARAPAPAQPITIMALSDSVTHARTLLTEIHPALQGEPQEGLLNSFTRKMFDNKVFTGLFITPETTGVVRDLVNSRDYENKGFTVDWINTEALLENVQLSKDLETRVRTWLSAVSTGAWSYFIPKEAYPFMIPYVVGSLADAVFEDWDARE